MENGTPFRKKKLKKKENDILGPDLGWGYEKEAYPGWERKWLSD